MKVCVRFLSPYAMLLKLRLSTYHELAGEEIRNRDGIKVISLGDHTAGIIGDCRVHRNYFVTAQKTTTKDFPRGEKLLLERTK